MRIAPLAGQPHDELLLAKSRIYKKSRELFLKQKGKFEGNLLSSPRSLGSLTLIKNLIEYSPLARELEWSLTDPIERKTLKHFELIRTFVTSVFHEQNHRILWSFLNSRKYYCPTDKEAACRFLNLAESLVITLDMALGDELDFTLAKKLYEQGVIYNTGSKTLSPLRRQKRVYRNALQVSFHTTYLCLEGMHPEDIPPAVRDTLAHVPAPIATPAIERAMSLDPLFVELTNPIWQKKHVQAVIKAFAPKKPKKSLVLPVRQSQQDPQSYILAEAWFELFGL